MMQSRRGFVTGLIALVAAPAVIRSPGLLMPVRGLRDERAEFLEVFAGDVLEAYAETDPKRILYGMLYGAAYNPTQFALAEQYLKRQGHPGLGYLGSQPYAAPHGGT
jgi:hypothetical protein